MLKLPRGAAPLLRTSRVWSRAIQVRTNVSERIRICDADVGHVDGAKRLADAHRDIFSFITRGAFCEAQREGMLIVALMDDDVVGFVRYRHRRRDLQTTLYDICVAEFMRRSGIGRVMMKTLFERSSALGRESVVLKCPTYLEANGFYGRLGFLRVDTLAGKRHAINVWKYELSGSSHL